MGQSIPEHYLKLLSDKKRVQLLMLLRDLALKEEKSFFKSKSRIYQLYRARFEENPDYNTFLSMLDDLAALGILKFTRVGRDSQVRVDLSKLGPFSVFPQPKLLYRIVWTSFGITGVAALLWASLPYFATSYFLLGLGTGLFLCGLISLWLIWRMTEQLPLLKLHFPAKKPRWVRWSSKIAKIASLMRRPRLS